MATALGAFLARGGFTGALAGGAAETVFGAGVFFGGGACLGASVFFEGSFEDSTVFDDLAAFFTVVFATVFPAFLTAFRALPFAVLAFAPFFAFEVLLASARAEVLRDFALLLALFFAAFLAVFFGRVATTNSFMVSNAIDETRRS
jgi:hypothetical protein